MSFVKERIQSFLSEQEVHDEFNHTILHGQHVFDKPKAKSQKTEPIAEAKPAQPEVEKHPLIP